MDSKYYAFVRENKHIVHILLRVYTDVYHMFTLHSIRLCNANLDVLSF